MCFGEQDMQNSLDRESSSLKDLESQKQIAQERLEEMDQQRSKLEGMLNDVKQKCQEESQMVRERDTFYLKITYVCTCGATFTKVSILSSLLWPWFTHNSVH